VSEETPGLSVDDIIDLLAGGARRTVGAGTSLTQLDHALQTATILQGQRPDDPELAAAGLVHDIGHLIPGVGDEAHPRAGADAVRAALGERVAGLVAVHVEAKRYLMATEPGYELAPDSVASLAAQGGAMSPSEAAAFEAQPLAPAALRLRRADEGGKDGAAARNLGSWVALLRGLSKRRGATGG
jgi:predicted HD phosphohydrolase